MRFRQLDLKAFGPFTDVPLDFGDGAVDVHILYGLNEAGKSSALRAVRALLYGIPVQTKDNFVHEHRALRIGGIIERADGGAIAFVRRKGRKDTILAAGEEATPLGDGVLAPFLRGADEQLFSTVFGIDHEALEQGGQAILRGRGEVGESLFAAGLGSLNLSKVIAGLEEEAKALFAPRGQNPVVNKALSEFSEAKRRIAELSLSGRAWDEHDRALKSARTDAEQVAAEMRRLNTEKTRLERLQRILPILAQRAEHQARLTEMGRVVVLPADFAERRRDAQRGLETVQETKRTSADDAERLTQQAAALSVPQALLDEESTVADLHERLGGHRKAARDLPGLRAKEQQFCAEAEDLLRDLRPSLPVDQIDALRLTTSQRTRIRTLGEQYQSLVERQKQAVANVRRADRDLTEARRQLDLVPLPQDVTDLHRAVAEVQRQGDLETALRSKTHDRDAEEQQIGVELSRLGLWSGTIEALERLPVPSTESLEPFDRRFGDVETTRTTINQRIEQIQTDLQDLGRQIEELHLAGEVPTEANLADARRQRDALWALIRRTWLAGEDITAEAGACDPEHDLPEAYERAAAAADELADRLRREADRVARHAALLAQQHTRTEELQRQREKMNEARAAVREAERVWAACWQPAEIAPRSPREMRAWLTRHAALIQRAETLRRLNGEVEQLRDRIGAYRAALTGHFIALGQSVPEEANLQALVDQAVDCVQANTKAETQRTAAKRAVAKEQESLDEASGAREDADRELKKWAATWSETVRCLDLDGTALPAEANAVLEQLEDLAGKSKELKGLAERIQGIEDDAARFSTDVATLVRRVTPDLDALPAEQAAERLFARLTQAQKDQATQRGLEQQVAGKAEAGTKAEQTILTMQKRLADLCREARCEVPEALPELERRSEEYFSLQKEVAALEERLLTEGAGATLDALVAEAAGVNGDELPAQIEEVRQQLVTQDKKKSGLDQAIGREEVELGQMDGQDAAAEAAERAQGLLAQARTGAERYVRLRLAVRILRDAIERYRAEHQAPLLNRASDLFANLTVGSFARLQAEYGEDDQPVLVGVRESGENLGVEAMSDGTRDQLYLSLRLATLERLLAANEPMPFIVDDILIRFDDERAAATLKVLADLSRRTQVLFFTHHARLVHLAEGLANTQVITHELTRQM